MTDTFPQISPIDALQRLAAPDAPVVLDVRLDEDIATHPDRVPTAVSVPHLDGERQIALSHPRGAIVVCHGGLKISAGVTARLKANGIPAWRLIGGQMGWVEAGCPVIPNNQGHPASIAIALDAGPDDVVRAWWALRFLNPEAEFLEVPRDDLAGVCARFEAQSAADLPQPYGLASATLLAAISQSNGLLPLLLQGTSRPSDAFPTLDRAFIGALRHETVTGHSRAADLSPAQESRP